MINNSKRKIISVNHRTIMILNKLMTPWMTPGSICDIAASVSRWFSVAILILMELSGSF